MGIRSIIYWVLGHWVLGPYALDATSRATAQICGLVEVLHENWSNLHFDSQLFGFWVVMNIINGIAKEGSPCVLLPPSLALEEVLLWERSTNESDTC